MGMTEAPERIWINKVHGQHPEDWNFTDGVHLTKAQLRKKVEYTRADLVDPKAIREAALIEAAAVARKGVEAFGAKMRAAPNKQEKRDWQSMLMGAVDIEHAILALIQVSASQNDKKEG
jgi:hypothetical protein